MATTKRYASRPSAHHACGYGADLPSSRPRLSQWRLEQDEGAWTLRNHHSGKYLGIEGQAGDGTPVVAVDEPFRWDIWPDEEDSATFRCGIDVLAVLANAD